MKESFETWLLRYEYVDSHIRTALGENISDDEWKLVRGKIHHHCRIMKKKWEECSRKKTVFLKKFDAWLMQIIKLTVPSISPGIIQSI